MVGLCRLCASFRKMNVLITINDESNDICQKLRKCCQLDIKLHDALPKYVCQECLGNLNVSHKFYVKVQESQETLQTLFPTKATEAVKENESWVTLAKTVAVATEQNKRKLDSRENEDRLSARDGTDVIQKPETKKLKLNCNEDTKDKETPLENVQETLETVENEKYLEDVYNELGLCKDEVENENSYEEFETIEESSNENKAITEEHTFETLMTIEGDLKDEVEEHETIYVDTPVDLCMEESQPEEVHITTEKPANKDNVKSSIQELCIKSKEADKEVEPTWHQESVIEFHYIEDVEEELDKQIDNEEIQSETEVQIIELDEHEEMSDENVSSPSQITSWQLYTYPCTRCEYKAKSFLDLKSHADLEHDIKHLDNLQFQCYDCQKIIPKYNFYLNHIRSQHHPALKLQCDVCDLNFENYLQLATHRNINCLEAEQFGYLLSCTECFKTFQSTNGLQIHNRQQHSSGEIKVKFQCTHCGKVFQQKSCLKRHELFHTDTKKHSCGICDKTFVSKSNLDLHLYSHIEEKTHQCLKCDKSFKTFLTLNRHQVVHLKQKPFKCEFCEKDFRNKGEKLTHERVHTGELPFKCKQCDKCFRFLSALNVHIRNHNGEKPFACDYCDKSFIDTSNRNKHMKRKHPDGK